MEEIGNAGDHQSLLSHLGPPLTNHMINVEINVALHLTVCINLPPLTLPPSSLLPLPPMAAHAGKLPMAGKCRKVYERGLSDGLLPSICFFFFCNFLFTNQSFITAHQPTIDHSTFSHTQRSIQKYVELNG